MSDGIIIFTDIRSDVDDVGAIAMAALSKRPVYGLISSTNSMSSLKSLAVLDNHYNMNARIGIDHRGTSPGSRDPYSSRLAKEYPLGDINDKKRVSGLMKTIRRSLRDAKKDGRGVEIVSLGGIGSLARILGDSRTTQLMEDVVTGLTIMAGDAKTGKSEFNIRLDPQGANLVAREWPTRINWVGYEEGVDVLTGSVLQNTSGPVRRAYQMYPSAGGTGKIGDTKSWDKVAMASVLRPNKFNSGAEIIPTFGSDGTTTLRRRSGTGQRFLSAKSKFRVRRFINSRLKKS